MTAIQIAIIGFGRWGQNLSRLVEDSSSFKLAAIIDVDPERRRLAASLYPSAEVFDRLTSARAASSFDAVAIATPPSMLSELAFDALRDGVHVFLEKPGATTQEGALDLARAARGAGKILFIDFTPVWSPLQDAMGARLASGSLGTLEYWRAQRTNVGYAQPGIDVLRDLAIHDLAVLDDLVAEAPSHFSLIDAQHHTDGRLSAGTLRLGFDNGLVADIVVSWDGPQRVRQTRVVGANHEILRDDVATPFALTISGQSPIPAPVTIEPLARAIEAFAQSIRTGVSSKTDAFAAVRLLGWIEAAERSIGSGS